MIINSPKTCKEVFEILRVSPKAEIERIPIEVLNKIKNEAKKYSGDFKLKVTRYGEPIVSHNAQVMILGIYKKYFTGDSESKIIDSILEENEKILEIKKVENYNNPDDIFYSNDKKMETVVKVEENGDNINKEMIIIQNKFVMFFEKILFKIKKFFKLGDK